MEDIHCFATKPQRLAWQGIDHWPNLVGIRPSLDFVGSHHCSAQTADCNLLLAIGTFAVRFHQRWV